MTHNFVFLHETDTDAVFQCTNCGYVIGFNKEGVGDPHSPLVDGAFVLPADAENYCATCTGS